MIEQPPAMICAGFENLRMKIQIESVIGNQASLAHGPKLHRIQKYAAVARSADEYRNRQPMTRRKQSGRHAGLPLLFRVDRAQPVPHLRSGHLSLELGTRENGR